MNEELKNVDITKVNKDSLVDVSNIYIDKSLSLKERQKMFIEKVKNPYCYVCNGIIIKSKFAETGSNFSECFNEFINSVL